MSSSINVANLCEAYRCALETTLQFPCTINNSDIDIIHDRILKELVCAGKKCHINCTHLHQQVAPILQQAKEHNITRKFAFDTSYSKIRNRYQFPIYDKYMVIDGNDNSGVLREIKDWLCDFGSEHDKFQMEIWGYHSEMGYGLERIRDRLTVDSLMQDLLRYREITRRDTWEPDNIADKAWRVLYYVQVQPIKIQFWFHEPIAVESKHIFLESEHMNFTINGKHLSVQMPRICAGNVDVTFEGEIEYTVTKGVHPRKWNKFLTFGITCALNKTGSTTKVHRVKLKTNFFSKDIKMREKMQIDISLKSAEKFMKLYKDYESIESIDYRDYRQRLAITMTDHEPLREFVEAMRIGGPKAVKEMVLKKPVVLKNLPNDVNNVAGIAFEELQIARILAEAQKRGVDIELFAGDGRGVFEFNNQNVQTPEYIDAVFYNKKTNEYFGVQFKYADKPEYLLEMMTRWRQTHQNRQPAAGDIPDSLLLDNVHLLGPGDVVELMEEGHFLNTVDLGFKHTPLERKTILNFLEKNEKMLKTIVNDKNITDNIKKRKNLIKKIKTKTKKLKLLQQNGRNEPNTNTKYDTIKNEVESLSKQLESTDKELHLSIKTYVDKNIIKQCLKQIGNAALLGGIIDGVVSLVTSCDVEIRKWNKGEISIDQCVWHITKNTAIGTARGAVIGGVLCMPEVASQIAIYHGYNVTGGVLSNIGKFAGPALMIGMIGCSTYSICKQYNEGNIMSADAMKSMSRLLSSTIVSVGGMIATGALIGGPMGLVVGGGLAICTAIGDYFLGDKLWSLIIKEDPEERKALIEKKCKEIVASVLDAAYELFDLTEHASDEELRAKVRAARLKYHPDKGGDPEIFKAVEAAYSIIRANRE